MDKIFNDVLSEIKDAQKYHIDMENADTLELKEMYTELYNAELSHAKMLIEAYPNVKNMIDEYQEKAKLLNVLME